MGDRYFLFFVRTGSFVFPEQFIAFYRKNISPASEKYQDQIQVPLVRRSSYRLLEIDELFNSPIKFLVVVADSFAQYLLKFDLSVLSLAMGSDAVRHFDTSLQTDGRDLTLNQIADGSSAAVSRPSFW